MDTHQLRPDGFVLPAGAVFHNGSKRQEFAMERNRYIISPVILLTGLFLLCGCSQTVHTQKKQQMVQAWEKSTAQAKLSGVRDQLDRGQMEEAKKILAECMKADPENPQVLFLIARIHLAEGRTETALQFLQKSLALNPQQDEAWFALGILYQEQKNYEQAQACTLKALELQPAHIDYILALVHLYTIQNQLDQAQSLLDEKRRLLPYDIDLLMASADLAQRKGQPQEAVRLYKEAVYKYGSNPRLLEALGVCYLGQQQWDQAADVFEKLLRLYNNDNNPAQDHVLGWLAYSLLQAGRYGKALTYYDRLSVSRREDPQVWLEMGQAALGAESPDRAVYCGQRALRLQSDWTDAEVVVGCGLYMQKNYSGAVEVFRKICQDSKWEAFGWWMAGRCYQQLGQNALARSAFEKASRLQPESPLIRTMMNQPDPGVSDKSGKTL
jgi:tetratricopeptide (TPR) repeat protein